jgi:hypothetical protein
MLQIYSVLLVFLLVSCFQEPKNAEFEFCFSTMVNGEVVLGVSIDDTQVPCGVLGSTGGQWKNEGYDFERKTRYCGASASGYKMEIPDSAFLDWSFQQEGYVARKDLIEYYKKRIKLPEFPKKKWYEIYRVYFVIAYQDCVYCKIESVEK